MPRRALAIAVFVTGVVVAGFGGRQATAQISITTTVPTRPPTTAPARTTVPGSPTTSATRAASTTPTTGRTATTRRGTTTSTSTTTTTEAPPPPTTTSTTAVLTIGPGGHVSAVFPTLGVAGFVIFFGLLGLQWRLTRPGRSGRTL